MINDQHVYVSFLIGEDPHSPPDAPVLNRFYYHKPWSELHPKPTGCLVIRLPGNEREYTYFPTLPFDFTRDGHISEFCSWNPVPGATWTDGSPANVRMLWLLATLTPESNEVAGHEIGKFIRYGLHLRNQESDAKAEEARITARLERLMADRPLPPSPNLSQEELCAHLDEVFQIHIGKIHSRLGRLFHEGPESDPIQQLPASPTRGKLRGKRGGGGSGARGFSGPSRASPLAQHNNGGGISNGYGNYQSPIGKGHGPPDGNNSPSYPPFRRGSFDRDPKRKRGSDEDSTSTMQPLDDADDRGSSKSMPTTSGHLRDGTRGNHYRETLPFPKSKQRTGN